MAPQGASNESAERYRTKINYLTKEASTLSFEPQPVRATETADAERLQRKRSLAREGQRRRRTNNPTIFAEETAAKSQWRQACLEDKMRRLEVKNAEQKNTKAGREERGLYTPAQTSKSSSSEERSADAQRKRIQRDPGIR
ncbi:hypothetical protein HPB50_005132 [Hyalomma asiaticum]|uniref:Uncharacterized protein n=1 Tax=Hyalomma asiaticum TaxID=266040 RepID=A0ACB7S4Z5_HYAAI|nr:hypothetical protein HPB50_005132 [Hyalomma asiaticum]